MKNSVTKLKFFPQERINAKITPAANAFLNGPFIKKSDNKAKKKTDIPT